MKKAELKMKTPRCQLHIFCSELKVAHAPMERGARGRGDRDKKNTTKYNSQATRVCDAPAARGNRDNPTSTGPRRRRVEKGNATWTAFRSTATAPIQEL